MPIDTAQKRRAVGALPHLPLGINQTPDVAKPVAWRQTAGWGYMGINPNPPPPVVPTFRDKFTLGTKESLGVTVDPTVGGWWGH